MNNKLSILKQIRQKFYKITNTMKWMNRSLSVSLHCHLLDAISDWNKKWFFWEVANNKLTDWYQFSSGLTGDALILSKISQLADLKLFFNMQKIIYFLQRVTAPPNILTIFTSCKHSNRSYFYMNACFRVDLVMWLMMRCCVRIGRYLCVHCKNGLAVLITQTQPAMNDCVGCIRNYYYGEVWGLPI